MEIILGSYDKKKLVQLNLTGQSILQQMSKLMWTLTGALTKAINNLNFK